VDAILEVKGLRCSFDTRRGTVRAVDGVDFRVRKGEMMALVGESGCGKSVTAQAIMGLIGRKAGERVEGEIRFKGENLLEKRQEEWCRIRGSEIAMVLQDPMTSLNPVHRIGRQVGEVLELHRKGSRSAAWSAAVEMLGKVGISSPEVRAKQYPHQFSGGMRQRSVIAAAFIGRPELLIADEPTTALDVTIQAQILDLMRDLREQTKAAILLITHDLGVVAETCDTVSVMYAGRIVEQAPVQSLFASPRHPYTQGLLASLPKPEGGEALTPIPGQPPDLSNLPPGCAFADRCPHVMERCRIDRPPLRSVGGHRVSCWLVED
jgi:oligopeptide/dipeptide ABC transporter ATP-binding protein